MEEKGVRNDTTISQPLISIIRNAQTGDKQSMENVIDLFTNDIEYLSRFIMQPREDTIQALKTELMDIICYKL